MQLNKLISLRAAQRRIIAKQFEKLEEISSTSESQKLLDIIQEKTHTIRGLNEKIINHADLGDIETELFDSEEYSIELEMKIHRYQEKIKILNETTFEQRDANQNHFTTGDVRHSTQPEEERVPTQTSNRGNYVTASTKLPKLTLPTFSGNISEWQTFWDSFDSAVHQNPILTDVQKFSYLRSLIEGSAAMAIGGFPLTGRNYQNAIELLRERYGQTHKIIDNFMTLLLELPPPRNSVHSLREFHDKMETYIRGLESLGQSQDSFGDLLVQIIMQKLPPDVRRNLIRSHGDDKWQLQELRVAIGREIRIMDAGYSNDQEFHLPTASFLTASKREVSRPMKSNVKPLICPFCSEYHQPQVCNKIIDIHQRIDIVKSKRLCFNCLNHHKVSLCKSKFRCHCKSKHHSSKEDDTRFVHELGSHSLQVGYDQQCNLTHCLP